MASSHQVHKVQPIERFPTKPRPDGRFQKRINTRLYYFGQDGDRAAAIAEYDRVKHDLYAGRKPRPTASELGTITLKELANRFTTEKEDQAAAGEISLGHLADYRHALRRLLKHFGGDRLVDDLRPEDFTGYARHLRSVAKLGPFAFNRERACVVAMFNHADQNDWIARAVRVGQGFKKESTSTQRGMKKRRMFTGTDVRKLVKHADAQLAAMILLGINAGFGATDCAVLLRDHVDLKVGRIHTVRKKRNIIRDVPLWGETVDALRRVMAERPDDAHVFRKSDGKLWVQEREAANINAVTKVFSDLLDAQDIDHPKGVGFNALRHTFATIASQIQDREARQRIMGQKFTGLDDVYVEDVYWQRLKRVTDHVRSKVFSSRGNGPSKRRRTAGAGRA